MFSQDLISTALSLREQGLCNHKFSQSVQKDWISALSTEKRTITNHSKGQSKPLSKIVWLGGRQNILATLDSHGRVVCHNLITESSSLLTSAIEHAYKIFFTPEHLLLAVKTINQETLSFYSIALSDMQNGEFLRVRRLAHLNIPLKNIKEIHQNSSTIVIENLANIQVWNILTDSLLSQFPLNQHLSYQFSSGFFVFWQVDKTFTTVGVICLANNRLSSFKICGTQKTYLCEVKHNKLIMGMEDCHLQIIDLDNGRCDVINKGVPKIYYQIESSGNSISIFSDGTGIVIGKDISEIRVGGNDFMCNDMNGVGILCDNNGRVVVLDQGRQIQAWTQLKSIEQVGTNPDTSQIFLATRGKIHIFE